MLKFLKNLFGCTSSGQERSGCCGGGCRNKTTPIDLGISDNDRSALALVDEKVVVGRIVEIRDHKSEKVTKVKVTTCDLGNGQTEQILCGGGNIAEGQIVPVATVGAKLSPDFIIGERDIRGEVSRGMICARQEIGLMAIEAEKGGIWIMPSQLERKLGVPINQLV